MLAAMVDVVGERGAGNVTVADVVARSGVSRRTFYAVFEDREDCFLAAFDEAVAGIAEVVTSACERETVWRERVHAGLVALLDAFDREPGVGQLLIVETLAAGPKALARRARILEEIVEVVDEGRAEIKRGEGLSRLTAEGVVGAVLSVLHTRLLVGSSVLGGEHGSGMAQSVGLVGLVNPLMAMIVLPYLGTAASRRELARSTPSHRVVAVVPRRGVSVDPLRDLEMRLTYRTVRVLIAIAASPGSSNRKVAEGSGIADQGQISKLLSRLHRLGLVVNTGVCVTRGERNEWRLTDKGKEVHSAILHSATST
jgi:AcrR family transcriptional regulator